LLAVTQHLDLVHFAIRRREFADYLFEWLVGTQQNSALRWQADTDEYFSLIFQIQPRRRLDNLRGLLVQNINIEHRGCRRPHTGVGPSLGPSMNHLLADNYLLPLSGYRSLTDERLRLIAVGEHCQANFPLAHADRI